MQKVLRQLLGLIIATGILALVLVVLAVRGFLDQNWLAAVGYSLAGLLVLLGHFQLIKSRKVLKSKQS